METTDRTYAVNVLKIVTILDKILCHFNNSNVYLFNFCR